MRCMGRWAEIWPHQAPGEGGVGTCGEGFHTFSRENTGCDAEIQCGGNQPDSSFRVLDICHPVFQAVFNTNRDRRRLLM